MEIQVRLNIEGDEHVVTPEELKNWEEVACTYKRSDFDGVTKSFSSKFEFANDAYDLLLEAYSRKQYLTDAVVSVWVMNDNLIYEKEYEAKIDFTSLTIEDNILSVNSIEETLASIIKAKQTTKFEFAIGDKMKSDCTFHFDRIPILESLEYKFTYGNEVSDTSALDVSSSQDVRVVWLGNISSEIGIGKAVMFNDDQDPDGNAYILECYKKSLDINLECWVRYDGRFNSGSGAALQAYVVRRHGGDASADFNPSADTNYDSFVRLGGEKPAIFGPYKFLNDLEQEHPAASFVSGGVIPEHIYGLVDEWLYRVTYSGTGNNYSWQPVMINGNHATADEYFIREESLNCTLNLTEGDKLVIRGNIDQWSARILDSSFKFNWINRGSMCDIEAMTPHRVAHTLLNHIADGYVNIDVHISDYDPRLAKTIVVAAESVRGISNAKFYSTFNEFAEWMSVVFGYTFFIGGVRESPYEYTTVEFDGMQSIEYNFQDEECEEVSEIWYHSVYKRFVCYGKKNNVAGYFSYFPGWEEYNNSYNTRPRTDRLFLLDGVYYRYDTDTESLVEFEYDPDQKDTIIQDVFFVHRAELFNGGAQVADFGECEAVYSVNTSLVYSSIEIGYDKKDYDSINGRDEFNFYNSYTTGFNTSERKLTMKSKYRADSFGLEIAAQKRGADTTDSDTDEDVFFAYCERRNTDPLYPDKPTPDYYPDRNDYKVVGGLTDQLFNGAYSPMQCLKANEGLICAQADNLTLTFASSAGNSDIEIDECELVERIVEPEEGEEGEQSVIVQEYVPIEGKEMLMSGDVQLSSPLFTAGQVEFTTGDVDNPITDERLICVTDNGVRYYGYLKEVEYKFARQEKMKYKLIVKEMLI